MNIKEFNDEHRVSAELIKAAYEARIMVDRKGIELLDIIKNEMIIRDINAIKIDYKFKFGFDRKEWSFMCVTNSVGKRLATTVYLDDDRLLNFVSSFNKNGFGKTYTHPCDESTGTPSIIFGVGPIDLKAAKARTNVYTALYGYVMPDVDNSSRNAILHLAKIFNKCIEIFDEAVLDESICKKLYF